MFRENWQFCEFCLDRLLIVFFVGLIFVNFKFMMFYRFSQTLLS